MSRRWRAAVALVAALAVPACKGDRPAAPPPAQQPAAAPTQDAGVAPASGGAATGGAKAPPATRGPCTAEQVKVARAESKALFEQKAYRPAAERLATLLADCVLDNSRNADTTATLPNLDYYWVHSDLSFALHRAGDHVGCLATLAPLTTPRPPLSIYLYDLDQDKVGKAILHNEAQCRTAHEAGRADFAASPCPFKTDGQAAAALGDVCIVLGPPGGPADFEASLEAGRDISALCPSIAAFTRKASAEPVETLLEAEDGPLTDTSSCCNLTEIAMATRDGKRMIRVRGGGRDCFGGTAEIDLDAIYEWKADSLKMIEDASVVSH